MAPVIVDQVTAALSDLPEVKETQVDIVWSPPWTKDKMSHVMRKLH